MFSTAEKTKNVSVSRQQQAGGTFFRKAADESFFGAKEGSAFFGAAIQPKLSVSQPDDPYEKEADQVADTVMRMPDPVTAPPTQRDEGLQLKEDGELHAIRPKLASQISAVQCKEEEHEELVQAKLMSCIQRQGSGFESANAMEVDSYPDGILNRKPLQNISTSLIQRSGRGPPATDTSFEQNLINSKGGGSALPQTTRSFMESRFNSSFEGVRIHTGSTAQSLSRSINAQAFTHGNDIYFNSGKFSPDTAAGGHLLAHELTHTIQQGASKPVAANTSVSRKSIIQRAAEGSVPQLTNAVAKAKGEEGKVNANKEGPDGNREGWERLLEYFKTTFGEDKIIRNGQPIVEGGVAEDHIKKKSTIEGPRPAKPRPADNGPYMRDAMPSWCGIFVFWALNKGGVPMPKWELGGRMVTPEAAYPPGYIPKAGDIAYRDNYSHYAIVEKADGSTVTTVNGNTSGEDNLGAQVQTRDHPLSDWTAFFDPIKLKTGALGSGEGAVEERPKTLKELRKELFNIDRKAEPGTRQEEEHAMQADEHVQAKPELSDWSVSGTGDLHHTPQVQTKTSDEKLQAKEEETPEEALSANNMEHSLQRKAGSLPVNDQATSSNRLIAGSGATALAAAASTASSLNSNAFIQKQEETAENDRGPPVQLSAQGDTIQCSWFDDAFSTVTNFVADTLAEGKRMLLAEARDFVMAIPGYRALRVVLGEDPITGEEIDRNGHTFIEAAFDIMPGGRLLHEKLTELGALDDAANWIDGQIAGVENLVDNALSRVNQFIESITLERLASPRDLFEEAGNIIYSTIQSIIDFAVTAGTELLETVKRFLIDQLVTFIREQTPAYPLLRVLLGTDPVTDEEVPQNGTTILDALLELGGEEGREQRKQMQETGTFAKVADWIDEGIAVFSGAYDEIKAGFKVIWDDVSIEMLMHPIDTFNRIYNQFVAPVTRVFDFVVRAGRVILDFIKEVLMRRLAAWASTVRGYRLVTVIIGKDPFTDELVPFTMENVIRGFMSLMEGGDAQYDQLKESGAIDRTTAKITAAVERLNMTPTSIVQLFIDLWNSFSLNDLADPIGAFQRIIDRFGEPIGRLIAFVAEIVMIVIETILTLMNFPFDLINNIIAKAMQAYELIKRDPVGFLKNLLRAIKQGFIQFFDNILQHLLSGLVGWLMSELRDAGVPELTDMSLGGVIRWVLEILDITMEKIWEKLAAHPRIGPERVARIRGMINTLEGIWTFIRDVQERGIAAIWDKIQEQLSNLWDTIINSVKTWIMEQIVNRVVARLLSMLDPTGIMAVVNSAIALYSAIQSFIRYLREMLEVVNSFVEGLVDIANGNITTAANYLEHTMARAMPIVIGFLANQVGLSGVGRRVGELIGQAREMVDEAIEWLVDRAVTLGSRLLEMGRDAAGRVMSAIRGWLGLEKPFRATDGTDHRLYFTGSEESSVLTVASNPTPFATFISSVEVNGDPEKETAKAEALTIAGNIDAKKRERLDGDTDEAKEASKAAKITEVQGMLNSLSVHTAKLFGTAVPEVDGPHHTPSGDSRTAFGTSARIARLHKNNRPPGSAPYGAGHQVYDVIDQRRMSGGASFYVRGHLLNENLGGMGTWKNLTPLSRDTNHQHESQVESLVKAAVDSGAVVQYSVQVVPASRIDSQSIINSLPDDSQKATKEQIIRAEEAVPEALDCEAYIMNKNGNDYVQGQQIVVKTITNEIQRNANAYFLGGEPPVPPVYIHGATAAQLVNLGGISAPTASTIVEVCAARRYTTYAALSNATKQVTAADGTASTQPAFNDSGKAEVMSLQGKAGLLLYRGAPSSSVAGSGV